MSNSSIEPKRIKNFRSFLAKTVPKFPNDKATLQLLEQKPLNDQLIIYLNWRLRYVRQASRSVTIAPSASSDPRWSSLSTEINAFLQKVRNGEDLTPYLSLNAHTRGFTPLSTPQNSWTDKDFLLNVMSLHHFHLGMTIEKAGHAARTDEVLFALVSRDKFRAVGLFNHDVFENDDPNAMTSERARLWQLYTDLQDCGALADIGGFGGLGVTTAGTPTALVLAVLQRYSHVLKTMDPKFDDPDFLKEIFAPHPVPKKPKFEWHLKCLDLGMFEKKTGIIFSCLKGPN